MSVKEFILFFSGFCFGVSLIIFVVELQNYYLIKRDPNFFIPIFILVCGMFLYFIRGL